ncbi:hypothetical protein CHUAL_003397 [Chamberlinius hualienensis]
MAEGPPMYRPEEYIFHLRKWFADSGIQTTDNRERDKKPGKDGHEVNNVSIVLTELLDISELLRNLKFDLKLAHAGFVAEFIREPNNGVFLLLDFLKVTQLNVSNDKREENNNNTNNNNNNSHHHSNQSAGGTLLKNRPQQTKKMLADEYECLLSLKHATRYSETMKYIMDHPSGVFLAASCAHSNFMKSRVVALELLIKACEFGPDGHNHVQKAMSTLRLRFGEPVRFKFLVGMLSSPGNKSLTFQAYCLSFLNKMLETSQNICKRVYLQCEIDEAGLDMKLLQKFTDYRDYADHKAYVEAFRAWKRNYVDIESLVMISRRLTADNKLLRTEVEKLRESTKKLEEDKMSLINIERQLSEQCTELEQKVTTLSKSPETSQVESVSDRMLESKQGSSTEDTHENMGTPKTSSEESDANSASPSPQPHIGINKGSDAMSISSEDSQKLSNGKIRNGTNSELDLHHEENEIIIPHIKQRSPLYVWPNRNTTDSFRPVNTSTMSDEVFIRHHLMQDVSTDKNSGVSLRIRLLKNDNQKQNQNGYSSDEAEEGGTTNRHIRHDDFSLNWSYPAVPLPIAVVTSGKSSLQDMTSSSSSTSNNHVLASNPVLNNDRFVNPYRIPPFRHGPLSENTNYQNDRLSLDFHKTLFQRSYPVPASERLTRTFHV